MCVFVYIVSKFFHTAIREDSGVFFAFLLPDFVLCFQKSFIYRGFILTLVFPDV